MTECTIPALVAALHFMIGSDATYSIVNSNLDVCDYNYSSSACYRHLADRAQVKEDEYKRIVIDVLNACERDDD